MGQEMVNVQIGNDSRQYPKGTPYLEIAKEYQKDYTDDIVLVLADGRLQELAKTLKGDCTLCFLTTRDHIGHATYIRSMKLLLVKAIYDVCEHREGTKVRVHFSVSDGLYCTVDGAFMDAGFLARVKESIEGEYLQSE